MIDFDENQVYQGDGYIELFSYKQWLNIIIILIYSLISLNFIWFNIFIKKFYFCDFYVNNCLFFLNSKYLFILIINEKSFLNKF